jgi:chromosome partitioning protein
VRTIAIVNQKGGCGKTTTAINLAGILARRGLRTLLVDMDPQSHCAAGLAIPEQRIELDIGDAMLAPPDRPVDSSRLLWRTSRNFDLAPSRMKLAGLEAARGGLADQPDKERRLLGVLSRLSQAYDLCLIDCSPAIGLLTYNALAAADEVLIPVETSYFSLQGAAKQVSTFKSMAKRLGSGASYSIVATIHDESSALARDLLDELRRRFGKHLAPVVIRRDVTLKEAASFGQPVIDYAPTSVGARDYSDLAVWLVGSAEPDHAARPRVPGPLVPGPDDVFEPAAPERETPTVEVVAGAPGPGELRRRIGEAPEAGREGQTPEATMTLVEPAVAVESKAGLGRSGFMRIEGEPSAGHSVTTAVAEPPAESVGRAEDLAFRARLLELRRADERLRRLSTAHEPDAAGGPVLVRASAARAQRANLERLFGVTQTRSGVLFVQPSTVGRAVSIAGDFNEWSVTSHPMRLNESLGVFELCVRLAPGRHRYRLVVDGRWQSDGFNEQSEPNPFGELNSVIEVSSRCSDAG